MKKKLNIIVSGQVHGVGFRFSSYEKFVELGLIGKAENGKDGSVIIQAEGEEPALESFVEWAHKGPQGARVSNVDIKETSEDEKK